MTFSRPKHDIVKLIPCQPASIFCVVFGVHSISRLSLASSGLCQSSHSAVLLFGCWSGMTGFPAGLSSLAYREARAARLLCHLRISCMAEKAGLAYLER